MVNIENEIDNKLLNIEYLIALIMADIDIFFIA